ncbi:MAG: response regulator transcription factor [Dehalococcoidia bacterium]
MERILLIHPDMVLRDRLTFSLQHSGFQVVGASSGQQALTEMCNRHADVVVVAESSHRLNGDELCVRLRQICQTPIIILGQGSKERSGIDFIEMGADAYLASPLDLRELLARIRSLLRRTQANATGFEAG